MAKYRTWTAPPYGKGKVALAATTNISAGEVILSEKPMLTLKAAKTPDAVTRVHNGFFRSITELSEVDLNCLKNLAFRSAEYDQLPNELKNFQRLARSRTDRTEAFEKLAIKAFFAFSIPFAADEEAQTHRLFSELSSINHSCNPNATLTWNEGQGEMVLRATSPMEEGDEITVSYVTDPFRPKADRHAQLGFPCICRVCTTDWAVVEEKYVETGRILHDVALVGKRLSELQLQLPDHFREADWTQVCAMAHLLGEPHTFHAMAASVSYVCTKTGYHDVRFADVHAVLYTASLAWYLTHPDVGEEVRTGLVRWALEAKWKEIRVLVHHGKEYAERVERAMEQLSGVAGEFEDPEGVMEDFLEMAGLRKVVAKGGMMSSGRRAWKGSSRGAAVRIQMIHAQFEPSMYLSSPNNLTVHKSSIV